MINILIIIIIIFTVLRGYRRSLFQNFFDFASLFFGLFIAFNYFGKFAGFLENFPGIKQFLAIIRNNVLSKLDSLDNSTQFTLQGFKDMQLSKPFNAFFEKGSFFQNKSTISFSELSMGLVTNVLAIVILFLLSVFLIRLLTNFLEGLNHLAGVSLIDRVGGVLFSLMRSFIYVTIVALAVYHISIFFNSGFFYDLYHGSSLAKFFYDGGIFIGLFS